MYSTVLNRPEVIKCEGNSGMKSPPTTTSAEPVGIAFMPAMIDSAEYVRIIVFIRSKGGQKGMHTKRGVPEAS